MWIVTPNHRVSAEDVRRNAVDPEGVYFVHRGQGEHGDGAACWCSPMQITGERARAEPLSRLQYDLNAHFAVH